jgi:Tfp pilus assembly protein PilV
VNVNRGSTLIESLVAAVILVSGLVSVASIFSVTTGTSLKNQQRTTATLLLYDKMEQLRGTASVAGGGLDPMNPIAGFMDYSRVAGDGTIVTVASDTRPAYLRLWQVQDTGNPTITIAVFAAIGAGTPLELIRATGPR